MRRITSPLTKAQIKNLKAGEEVLLSGAIYTARDQAHRRLCEAVVKGKKPPIELEGQIIYYCGPTQTPPGQIIGSCGPTTSARMDEFTPILLKAGIAGMIGKGRRSKEVVAAIKKYGAVYFLTYAGCAALLTQYVKEKTCVVYQDLGPEAIYKITVENFPLIVAIDAKGRDIYA
ncbi:MAG: FumA C-terminus/TtdB family hydratase beta subunit [Candidatus Omnitrophica bacterium]|nr:FumA C-terminus/TtdB family hydratase beta subunit [Candidatus Omnitrophota bacterium]